jgi:hypothetical protein
MKSALLIVVSFVAGAFMWWAFSPLLLDKVVEEELDPTLKARIEAQNRVDEERVRQAQKTQNVATSSVSSISTESNAVEAGLDATSEIVVEGPFSIVGTPQHPATGEVEIIRSPEETLIQYKNYNGTNGPDLKIYLAKDLEAKEFISLGDAKGNQGNLIYGAPLDIDFAEYPYILTWCEAFDVLFDYVKVTN